MVLLKSTGCFFCSESYHMHDQSLQVYVDFSYPINTWPAHLWWLYTQNRQNLILQSLLTTTYGLPKTIVLNNGTKLILLNSRDNARTMLTNISDLRLTMHDRVISWDIPRLKQNKEKDMNKRINWAISCYAKLNIHFRF